MRAPLALLLVLGAATTAHAGNNELTIGTTNRGLRSSSANTVTDEDLFGGRLTYARRLDLPLLPRLELWATASMTWGGASGTLFQTLDTEIGSFGLIAGGRARYLLHHNLAATGHFELGSARASLTLKDSMGHTASDHQWGATSEIGAGVDLLLVAQPAFSLGVRLDFGYVVTSAVELTGKANRADDKAIVLAMTTASLGHLDLGGPYFAASLISQF